MSDVYIFIVFVNGQVDNTFSRRYTADKYASILREHLKSLDSPLGTPEVTVGKYSLNEGVENSAQAVFDDLYGLGSETHPGMVVLDEVWHIPKANTEWVNALARLARDNRPLPSEDSTYGKMERAASLDDVNYSEKGIHS